MANRSRAARLLDPFAAVHDVIGFAMECQAVVALRMVRLAFGGAPAAAEARRMVAEKVAAVPTAGMKAVAGFAAGGPPAAASRVVESYRKTIRANRKRLSHAR